MSLFKVDTTGVEKAEDVVGGGVAVLDTGVYDATVKLAYLSVAKSGAQGLAVVLDVGGREHRETVYVTSGTAKGGNSYYERDGKKYPLPGFTMADDLALLTTGQGIGDQEGEEKVVKLYDFTARAEVPTKVMVITEMLGKQIKVAIYKNLETKYEGQGDNRTPTDQTVERNSISKFYYNGDDASLVGKTVNEIQDEKEATHLEAWEEKHKDKVKDNTVKAAGKTGAPGTAGTGQPKKSLFGK